MTTKRSRHLNGSACQPPFRGFCYMLSVLSSLQSKKVCQNVRCGHLLHIISGTPLVVLSVATGAWIVSANFKEIVLVHFGKYAFSLSGQDLNEKIDVILINCYAKLTSYWLHIWSTDIRALSILSCNSLQKKEKCRTLSLKPPVSSTETGQFNQKLSWF